MENGLSNHRRQTTVARNNIANGSKSLHFVSFPALKIFEDDHHLGLYNREQELKQRTEDYR